MKTELDTKINKKGTLSLLAVAFGFVALSACTKEVPFKNADPNTAVLGNKADFDAEPRLMSVSMQNASRTSEEAFPYSAGDTKRVKFEINEKTLRVIETEADARYASNKANDKLVLEIPVEHSQLRCVQDKYGECTNEEAEATDIPWNLRTNMKLDLANAKTTELDMLPLLDSATWGQNCYKEVSSRLVSSKIDHDAMNFDIERTFVTNIECLNELNKITDATVVGIYHYSIVRLAPLLSKDFKVVSYPDGSDDESTFGFFSSKRLKLDAANNNTEKSTIQVMNHWNPNRKVIDYYLSDEFAKPENKVIKDLTYKTISNLNNGLSEAGVSFRIDLHEPAGKNPGDIRNSMIVLVEDPMAASVIGYGPQTEDPVTGEIVSARTVMFLGTIKSSIFTTYEDIRREKLALALEGKADAKALNKTLHLAPKLADVLSRKKLSGKSAGLAQVENQISEKILAAKASEKGSSAKVAKGKLAGSDLIDNSSKLGKMKAFVKDYTALRNPKTTGNDLKSKLEYLHHAKNCALEASASGVSSGISKKLMDKFPDAPKPWFQLTDEEKDAAIAIILPEVWVSTLIHEMGHNLGLRHNFSGSEDKANFHSIEDINMRSRSGDVDNERVSSSVMDYVDDLRALPVLGKYDIAALKFGYLRQVEKVVDDKVEVIPVATTLEDLKKADPNLVLKDYGYCTDEHVGINAGCKRFDLGTSYTEITQNLIKQYEDWYSIRNFRSGRASFSLGTDYRYAMRMASIFEDLRVMMEVRERIKYRFNLADDAPEYEQVEFLKDLNQAALLAGVTLAKVLMVPDTTCAVALKTNPSEVIAIERLNNINPEALSCFELKLQDQYVVVGQAGKSLNSKKDPESKNSYANEIDLRGIWADKIMAADYLLTRKIGISSMDKNVDNFLNIDVLRQPVIDALTAVMTNNVVDAVTFTLADGSKGQLEISYDLFDSQLIDQHMYSGISRALGLHPERATQFQELLGSKVADNLDEQTGAHTEDIPVSLAMKVKRLTETSPVNVGSNKSAIVDGIKFVAESSNVLATEAIDNLFVSKVLDQVAPKNIQMMVDLKMKKQPMPELPADMPEADKNAIKQAWKMKVETLQEYLDGTIKSSEFYARLLNVLPTSN